MIWKLELESCTLNLTAAGDWLLVLLATCHRPGQRAVSAEEKWKMF